MMCYRDRTYCSFWKECRLGSECPRALTTEVEKAAEKLALRVNAVQANLNGSGVRAERLNTEQIMQLYYNSYNFESSPLVNFGQLKDIKIVE